MIPEGSSIGKWTDEPCNKNNKVVCQRMQNWPISRLQKTFLDARKELQDSLEDVRKQLKESQEDRKQLSSSLEDVRKQLKESQEDRKQLNSSLEDVRKNPVPIGFIYVQLPSQPEPKTLWSMVEWKDVTSDYAGHFFRAEGGGSAAFGLTQEDNSPRLTSIATQDGFDVPIWKSVNTVPGQWSPRIETAGNSGTLRSLKFFLSSGEVRPRNKAVRIWKRTN
jgi:hypothetical protein